MGESYSVWIVSQQICLKIDLKDKTLVRSFWLILCLHSSFCYLYFFDYNCHILNLNLISGFKVHTLEYFNRTSNFNLFKVTFNLKICILASPFLSMYQHLVNPQHQHLRVVYSFFLFISSILISTSLIPTLQLSRFPVKSFKIKPFCATHIPLTYNTLINLLIITRRQTQLTFWCIAFQFYYYAYRRLNSFYSFVAHFFS